MYIQSSQKLKEYYVEMKMFRLLFLIFAKRPRWLVAGEIN